MFSTEKELVNSILKTFYDKGLSIKKYNKENVRIMTELNLWYWIPDIVIVNKKDKRIEREKILSSFDISILNIIKHERKINIDDIIMMTKIPRSKVNNSLSILIKEDIVVNIWWNIKFKWYENLISDCIAIEAKLKDRKRALHQAYRYKRFANESYVLLPQENISPALKNVELFKKLNVWLLGIDASFCILKHIKVKNESPISEKMIFLLNEHFLTK